jgi:hypothetical protein
MGCIDINHTIFIISCELQILKKGITWSVSVQLQSDIHPRILFTDKEGVRARKNI